MPPALSNELFWLTLTVAMTALMWVPYIVNRLIEHRPWPALMNPQPDLRPKARWAERLMRAHDNAVENLVIFAPLVIVVHLMGIATAVSTAACTVYFMARLSHAVLYTLGVPLLRTIAFFVGFLCQMVLASAILGLR